MYNNCSYFTQYTHYTKETKDMYKWESGYIKTARAHTAQLLDYDAHQYFLWGGRPQYLTGDYKTAFNKGKQAEVEDRYQHSKQMRWEKQYTF